MTSASARRSSRCCAYWRTGSRQRQAPASGGHQALRGERLEHRHAVAGHSLGCLDIAAAGERAQRDERVALVDIEQVVAPVQRRTHRSLPSGQRPGGHGPSTDSASPRRADSSAAPSTPSRPAASSIASGTPSNRRQISHDRRQTLPGRLRTPDRAPEPDRRTARRPASRPHRRHLRLAARAAAPGTDARLAAPAPACWSQGRVMPRVPAPAAPREQRRAPAGGARGCRAPAACVRAASAR